MKKRFFSLIVPVMLALLSLCVTPACAQVYVDQTPPEDWAQRDLLRLTVFRTGRSDCMLLEAGGECMMIDGGLQRYREQLRDALTAREITHLKYLYNTHPDSDHIGCLYWLMKYGFTADAFLSPFPADYDNELHARALSTAEKAGIPFRQLIAGDVLTLGEAKLTIFRCEERTTLNNLSSMTRVEYGACSALLTADITGLNQRYFLETLKAETLKADVVKFHHHGETPFVPEFLDAVDPAFVWATNFNDPDISMATAQIQSRSIPMKYSGEGTVILECDGVDWYITQTLRQF